MSLSSRTLLALVLLLGLALQAPSLAAGFYADDYVLAIAFDEIGRLTPMRPWSAFDFGRRADWTAFEAAFGALPWWTSPDWSVRFLRPLASLSLGLDHAVWGAWAPGHHLTSLLWYALLLALVHRLYRALGLGQAASLLGLLLLALNDASVLPVGWPANRNSLLEAVFAVGALLLALRARARPAALFGALLLAACATLSKESGVLAFLLVAWVLAGAARARPPGGERRALAAGACASGLAVPLWLAFLALAGYGTNSLFYATPWSDPLRFLSNLGVLSTGGTLALAGPFPLDVVVALPQSRLVVVALGLALGVPLVVWVARTLARLPANERSAATSLTLWTLVFLLPQASAAPGDRLLFVAAIGSSGLLARFLVEVGARRRRGDLGRLARVGAVLVLLAATLGSGAWLVLQGAGMARLARHLRATTLATEVGPLGGSLVDVVVLQTDSQMQGFTLGSTWHGAGGDPSVRFLLAQSGPRPVRWTRLSDTAFELESLGAPFLSGSFEAVYLSRRPDPRAGGPWSTSLVEVEALAHPTGELRRLRFTFGRSLDDPSLRFVRPEQGVLRRIEPPPVDAAVLLEAPTPALPFVP